MDGEAKVRHTIDALFGQGVSARLPRGVELSVRLAPMLLKSRRFAGSCVEVSDEAAPFVKRGRYVFCAHVTRCGRGRARTNRQGQAGAQGMLIA